MVVEGGEVMWEGLGGKWLIKAELISPGVVAFEKNVMLSRASLFVDLAAFLSSLSQAVFVNFAQ